MSKAAPLLDLFLSCGWICVCVRTIILSLDWKPHEVSYLVDSSHPHPLNTPAQLCWRPEESSLPAGGNQRIPEEEEVREQGCDPLL